MARLVAPPPPPSPSPGDRSADPLPAPRGTPGRLMTPPQPAPPAPTGRERARQRIGRPVQTVGRRVQSVLVAMRRLPRRVLVGLLMLVLAVTGGASWWLTRPAPPPPLTRADVDATVRKAEADQARAAAAAPTDATVAWTAIQPALVLVTVRHAATARAEASTSTGAGVVVKADGTILTAAHVVAGGGTVTVGFTDGTTSAARVATSEPGTDIATLTPATLPGTLVPATLGGSVVVGAPVFAVGHPLGLGDSLSAGVVSALDRSVRVEGGRTLAHLIQTDAAVNPGNSGGPLLDRAGHVVGIVTGLANPRGEGAFVGIGFAVPIATAAGTAGSPPR